MAKPETIKMYQSLARNSYDDAMWARFHYMDMLEDLDAKDKAQFIDAIDHFESKARYYSRTARELMGIEE